MIHYHFYYAIQILYYLGYSRIKVIFDTPQKGLHKTMGIYEGTFEDQYDDMFPQQIVLLFFLLLPFK